MSETRSSSNHWYKHTWLTVISSLSLAALPAKMSAFNSYIRQNVYHRNLKCIFEDLFPLIVTQQRPIVDQFAPEFRNLPLQAEKRI